MIDILSEATELAGFISESDEVKSYLVCKKEMLEDAEADKLIQKFQRIKEDYEEAQRFGRFHPSYHEAKERAQHFQKEMYQHPTIRAYLEAERTLDQLLYEVSALIANSVSPQILVPNTNWNRLKKGCKCKK